MKKPRYQVMRLLRRHLAGFDRYELARLRDELWDRQITRAFLDGDSMQELASHQPTRNDARSVEHAIRRRMRAGDPR